MTRNESAFLYIKHTFSEQKCGNFFFPPPMTLFPPPGFPFLPLVLNFGTRFPKFFLHWRRTSECTFRSFQQIWTRKTSENTFRSSCAGVKSEYWGVKKSHGEEENISPAWMCKNVHLILLDYRVWLSSINGLKNEILYV
jgi:hypothetical protein